MPEPISDIANALSATPVSLTHDEVRTDLRKIILEFAPGLATAVLDRRDLEFMEQFAQRVDAAASILKQFEEESEAHPEVRAFDILVRIEARLKDEPSPKRGPSIWELVQNPAL